MTVALRPITDADLPVLFEIYAGTRTEELAKVTWWTDSQKRAFLFQQFSAQHQYYLENYVNSTFDLILFNHAPVGRLYVARWENQLRIIDIALLSAYRGQGIGSQLIERLLSESRTQQLPLTIHVERENPALAWYFRMGFQMVEDKGVYLFLKATPASHSKNEGH